MTVSTRERRQRDKERRREEILRAAERIFADKGFESASMTEIARAAELSKGAVYLYFKGKDDLAFALFERSTREVLRLFTLASAGKRRGSEGIRAVTAAFLDYYRKNSSSYIRRNFAFFFDPDHMNNDSARACARDLHEIISLVIGILADGIRDGSIRADLDPVKTAHTYGNLVVSYMIRVNTGRGLAIPGADIEPEEMLDYTFDLVFRSIEN